ncbi:MAG: hypothetical protein Mars2KO_01920 [Maribacter sp.]
MNLRIQLKKKHHNTTILNCIRSDGSNTFTKLPLNLEIHDIAHYVVEKQLGFTHAFYGLLALGYEIGDFQLPREERPQALQPKNLHPEALMTEHLVNVLQIDFQCPAADQLDLIKTIGTILKENNLAFPEQLNQERLRDIREELKRLMRNWEQVEVGGHLELVLHI